MKWSIEQQKNAHEKYFIPELNCKHTHVVLRMVAWKNINTMTIWQIQHMLMSWDEREGFCIWKGRKKILTLKQGINTDDKEKHFGKNIKIINIVTLCHNRMVFL